MTGVNTTNLTISNTGHPYMKIRSTNGGTPFIDFSNDSSTDYHARFILRDSTTLETMVNVFRTMGRFESFGSITANAGHFTLLSWNELVGRDRVWNIHIEGRTDPSLYLGYTNINGSNHMVALAGWSKRELKEEIREYDYELAYDQIQNMPIYSFRYKRDDDSIISKNVVYMLLHIYY